MAARKTFEERLDDFIAELFEDGTIARCMADKRLQEQARKLRRLEREQRAIEATRKNQKGKRPA